jgi:hypothetical protein
MKYVFFLTAIAATSPAIAYNDPVQSETTDGHDSAKHYQAALKLAEALKPSGSIQAEASYAFDGGLAKDMQGDPNIAELEREYPGVTAHLLASMRDEIIAQVTKSIPDLWNKIAGLFAAEMNAAELAQAYDYYSSPAGQRLVAATHENADYSTLGKAIIDDPDRAVTANDVKTVLRSGVGKTAADMSDEDRAAILEFSKTAGFSKVRKLGPKVQEASAKWANESSPDEEKRIDDIATKAIEDFMQKADAQKAGKKKNARK